MIGKLIKKGPTESVYFFKNEKYIIKIFDDKEKCKNEIKIQKYASEIGISPKLLTYGDDFFITEYIHGDLLQDTKKTPELINKIDKIINRLHFYGILHNDLNEGNIIINNTGDIYILDFGRSEYKRFLNQKDIDNDYVMYDYE